MMSVLSMIQLGQELPGRYKIETSLGKGGYGAVFAGRDLSLDRPVAIKLFTQEIASQAAKRFRDEGRLIAKLQHPHIIQVYAFNDSEFQCPFLVMERFGTGSLRDHWSSDQKPSLPETIRIITQLLDALTAAHQVGVVHRDIKEANILYDHTLKHIKLCDFGIARALDRLEDQAQTTKEGCVIGTGHYIAPERYIGQNHDPRSDLYSVGVLFYRLLMGHRPHEKYYGEPLQPANIMFRITNEPIKSLVNIPRAIERICLRLLERDLTLRYQSAQLAYADLIEAFESPETESYEYELSTTNHKHIGLDLSPNTPQANPYPLAPPSLSTSQWDQTEPFTVDQQGHLVLEHKGSPRLRVFFSAFLAFFMGIIVFTIAWYLDLIPSHSTSPKVIQLGSPQPFPPQYSPTSPVPTRSKRSTGYLPQKMIPLSPASPLPDTQSRSKRKQTTTKRSSRKTKGPTRPSSPYVFPITQPQ